MKIAHVTATFFPHNTGTGNVAQANATELVRRGHEVHLFTAAIKGSPAQETIGGTVVHRLTPLLRYGNAPFMPGLFTRLAAFDLIHIHLPFYGGLEAVLLRRLLRRTPLVITHHQDVTLTGLPGVINRLHDRLLGLNLMRRADRVCFTSLDYARHSYYAPYFEREKWPVTALPNGVDIHRFTPGAPPARLIQRYDLADKFVILFVGVLDQAHYFKGVHLLLQAVAALRQKSVALLIVGEGEMRSVYQQQAVKLGIGDQVHFAGYVPDADLPDYYRLADVTTLPSTTAGEAFGLVLLESLACGTPVLASSLPGVRTVVADGQDGFLVEPGNQAALTAALQQMTTISPHTRHTMGLAGRRKVEERYAWERIGQRLEQLYQDILFPPGHWQAASEAPGNAL
jgi:glycosyltransferase involved in cell wall biosynthesis